MMGGTKEPPKSGTDTAVAREFTMRRLLGWLARLLVLVMLASAVIREAEAGIDLAWTADLLWASLAGLPLTVLGMLGLALRWQMLTSPKRVSLPIAFRAATLTAGLNVLLPFRGSELIKVIYVREHGGVRLQEGIAALVVERTLDLIAFALLGALTVYLFKVGTAPMPLLTLGIVALCTVAILPSVEPRLHRWLGRVRGGKFLQSQLRSVVLRLGQRQQLGAGAGVTVFTWITSLMRVAVFFTVLADREPSLGWQAALGVFAATTIGGALAVLPAGFGTYEAAAVVVLRRFGLDLGSALPIAVALHVSQLLPVTMGAIFLTLRENLGFAGLLASISQIREKKDAADSSHV